MNVLVASGGTRESIDGVRVITNISSGALGANIADKFAFRRHKVFYVCSSTAILPEAKTNIMYANSTMDVMHTLERLVPQMDVVVMTMAISDFMFKNDKVIKISSNSPEDFIEYMKNTIVLAPKVIQYVKSWNPKVFLVGFKFTVGKSRDELIKIAEKAMEKTGADITVCNDKTEMAKLKEHFAHLVFNKELYGRFPRCAKCGKDAIAYDIVQQTEELMWKQLRKGD